ncbi:MAG: glycosyltransferase [Zoogloeaceae bacterium]|nr:glycosyltransferase [Zoogloeaceae bacterium]
MRVLMVSDVYFPRVNGVSTSIETFRRKLDAEGVEVRLVVPRYADEGLQPGITRVAGRAVPGDPEDRIVGWRAMHRAVAEAAAGCDLIHVQTPFVAHYAGLAAGRKLGLPVLATYHTLFEEYVHHYAPKLPANWLRTAARAISRRQCNALDGVIVPSSAMKARLTAYGVSTPMYVLPTGIPLERFRQGDGAAFRAAHGIPAERPVALYVGRVAHEKNIGFLIDALIVARKQVPELLLLITGEGPASAELKQRVTELGLQDAVRFLGYLGRQQELPGCYKAADIFLFASRTETQGLVLLEAMAAGLPVMALSAMGTIDILAPGKGCITPPDDTAAFGEILAHFFNHPEVWRHLAAEAIHFAATWSDQIMAEHLASLYRDCRRASRTSCPVWAATAGL